MNKDNPSRFSNLTFEMLKDAGWFQGRDVLNSVELPKGFELFPAATNVLKEFGNLHVGRRGPGIERARSTVLFNPLLAEGEDDRFLEYSKLLQSTLYPPSQPGARITPARDRPPGSQPP